MSNSQLYPLKAMSDQESGEDIVALAMERTLAPRQLLIPEAKLLTPEAEALRMIVGLAGTVTIGPGPETNREKSLGDSEDSEDAYSCIMMGEEAGYLLCSLAGMLKIHLFDSSIKVHVPP